jgi:hypothetical protein
MTEYLLRLLRNRLQNLVFEMVSTEMTEFFVMYLPLAVRNGECVSNRNRVT